MAEMTQIRILLIRHGETAGNLEGRYVGRTDEDLCSRGRKRLQEIYDINQGRTGQGCKDEQSLPGSVRAVYSSPMKRCLQSARILFPGAAIRPLTGMQECDFGDFEYKNYKELSEDARYQAWIDSDGATGFPGGEHPSRFKDRVCGAFEAMISEVLQEEKSFLPESENRAAAAPVYALVCHGGCIMAIMERYALPHRDYFSWQIGNGQWLETCLDPKRWRNGDKNLFSETVSV